MSPIPSLFFFFLKGGLGWGVRMAKGTQMINVPESRPSTSEEEAEGDDDQEDPARAHVQVKESRPRRCFTFLKRVSRFRRKQYRQWFATTAVRNKVRRWLHKRIGQMGRKLLFHRGG